MGTRLITSAGEPALDGVYKLVAICEGGAWEPAIKISETPAKTLNPGNKCAWRLYDRRNRANADVLSLDSETPQAGQAMLLHHPSEPGLYRRIGAQDITRVEPLLVDVLQEGRLVYALPSLEEIRLQRQADVDLLDPGVKRLVNPHIYHVSLTERLWNLKQELIAAAQHSVEAGQ